MKLIKYTIICLFTSCLCSLAQDDAMLPVSGDRPLSLSQLIELSLAKNFTIRVERFNPEIAETEIMRERSVFDPVFETSIITSKSENPQVDDPFSDAPDAFTIEEDQFSLGLNGLLPTGLSYSVGMDTVNERGTFNDFEDAYDASASVSLVQPILRDFGSKTNRARIRIAKNNYELTNWEFRLVVMSRITETIFAYNDLYFAKRNLEVAQQSRDLADRLYNENLKRVELGSMAPLDVVVAEAELALRSERVLQAERVMLDQVNRLKNLISDNPDTVLSMQLGILPPEESEEFRPDPVQDFAVALEHRPDYQQALLGLDTRNIELVLNRNQALPALDVVGSFGLSGQSGGFGSSLGDLSSVDNQSYTVGMVFSVPIPNREGKSRRIAATLARNQSEVVLERLKQNIIISLDNVAGRIETNWRRIEAAGKARDLARKSLTAEQKKLQAGTSTSFVVLRLQGDLANAEIRELEAITDYNRALAEYDFQRGLTLRNHAVEL